MHNINYEWFSPLSLRIEQVTTSLYASFTNRRTIRNRYFSRFYVKRSEGTMHGGLWQVSREHSCRDNRAPSLPG